MKVKDLQNAIPGGADAALISSRENRLYLTSYDSTDGLLALGCDFAVFYTDARFSEEAAGQISACRVENTKDYFESLKILFEKHGVKTAAVETNRLSVAQFKKFKEKLPKISFFDGTSLDDALSESRAVKSAGELNNIKTAQSIAEAAFLHILDFIKAGRTERETALELEYFMLKNGAEAVAFETIAVSGSNTSLPHGKPTDKKLENGDFLTLDFGAVYNGYRSDMTRTVAIDRVTEEQREIYELVLKAQNSALAVLRAGLPCAEADRAARSVIDGGGQGEYFTHGTGHGVGVEIHEGPGVSGKSVDILKAGNIITVEPGIYIAGRFGVRIEDMAFITESGSENLTRAPKELIYI